MDDGSDTGVVAFRKPKGRKKRHMRKRVAEADADEEKAEGGSQSQRSAQEEEEEEEDPLERIKRVQAMRQRRVGTSAEELQHIVQNGLVDSSSMGAAAVEAAKKAAAESRAPKSGLTVHGQEDGDGEGTKAFGSTFTQESEGVMMDQRMEEYIQKRMVEMGAATKTTDEKAEAVKKVQSEVDSLYQVPDHLQVKVKNTQEHDDDMASIAIVEVDLPVEVKLRNIEATEAAKKAMMARHKEQRDRERRQHGNTDTSYIGHQRFAYRSGGAASSSNNSSNDRKRKQPPGASSSSSSSSVSSQGNHGGGAVGGHDDKRAKMSKGDLMAMRHFKKKEMNRFR